MEEPEYQMIVGAHRRKREGDKGEAVNEESIHSA